MLKHVTQNQWCMPTRRESLWWAMAGIVVAALAIGLLNAALLQ